MTRNCYQKALDLLALRPHFVEQLRSKLADRGYEDEEVADVLERLTESGLLDDLEAARGFVRSRLRRGAIGRRRMAMELARRGVGEEVVEAILAESFSGSDLEDVRVVAGRWQRRGKRDWQALARHLDRKGFSSASIWTAVEEFRSAQVESED